MTSRRQIQNRTQPLVIVIILVGLFGNVLLVSETYRTVIENEGSILPIVSQPESADQPIPQRAIDVVPPIRHVPPLNLERGDLYIPSRVVQPEETGPVFSFCLLIKDDNDILNEWIAYHYHILRLRHIIVAVDPSSETSPIPLLEIWKQEFGLQYEVWKDSDYMPKFFVDGNFDLVPRMIKMEDKNATKWQEGRESEEALRKKYVDINNHRFRQAKFLQVCARALQDSHKYNWMAHIDTDEYMVFNPTLFRPDAKPLIPIPKEMRAGCLMDFLQGLADKDKVPMNWPCISMPRILYGSVEDKSEDNHIVVSEGAAFQRNKMESLRWKYHADYFNIALNKQPKVVMDVSGFPTFNLTRRAFSIHRPNLGYCRMQAQIDILDYDRYPIIAHHYVGSLERYQARHDPRRTSTLYHAKADVQEGKDDDWMDTWLNSFVQDHGIYKVGRVLGQYMGPATAVEEDKPQQLGQSIPLDQDSFSACLLLKDDNDILSEWIAYHYHTLKLRSLVVAVDPSSRSSPSTILGRWRELIDIEEWTDESYMPSFFLQKEYHLVPNLIGNMTNSTTSIFHDSTIEGHDENEIKDDLVQVNNHRFRQATFYGSCIKHMKEKGKTWLIHVDSDEYIVLHPQVRKQDHWRKMTLDPTIRPGFLLEFLKRASSAFSKGLSYPCVAMPRLLYGNKEDAHYQSRFSKVPPGFNGTEFETLRWKYHSDYDDDGGLNGKAKVILDLTGLPPKANVLTSQIYSIHRPGLFKCRSDRDVRFDQPHKFPLTISHYIGSWERYNHRNDARRSRHMYDAKASVAAGKDDDWIDGWLSSFVNEHGNGKAMYLLKGDFSGEGDFIESSGEDETMANNTVPRSGNATDTAQVVPETVLRFDPSSHMEFSACLLVKDDNDILEEWIAYHYHVLGLRYMIVAVDSKSETSPSEILERWREFGMTVEEWKDEMFMPDIYFQKAYHLQPRLVKIKKNKHKWLEGIDDRRTVMEYFNAIQDHRFRQITFLSECAKKLKEQGRTWMVHIDTDEYIVVNPLLRKAGRFDRNITIPASATASIVPRLLNRMVLASWDTVNYPCISMPRLLYGSTEDAGAGSSTATKPGFNASRFETLRWKYHAKLTDGDLNKQPKVIMDVSAIPSDDKMFTDDRVFSIHRPSQVLCRNQGQMYFEDVDFFPFTVNHYLGTFERFSSRNDPRRNWKLYDQKAGVKGGKDIDGWTDSWIGEFASQHDPEKVSDVLRSYRVGAM